MFENGKIEKGTPIPLYYQLKSIILKNISNGNLKPGDMLPTEMEFLEIYGISRATIRQAIKELVNDGYVYRVKSKGTFVAKPKVWQEYISSVHASHQMISQQNMVPTTRILVLEEEKASVEVSEQLQIAYEDPIIHMKRLRFADDEPLLYTENYLTMACRDILKENMEQCGLYEFLDRKAETKVVRSVRTLTAVPASKEEAELLKIGRGDPVQLSRSVSYNKDNLPVEFAIVHFRGDRNMFVVELKEAE